jgi:dienelactone hydrolase
VIAPEHTGNTSFAQTGLDPALKSDTQFANKMEAVLTLHDDKGTYGLPENLGQSIPRNDTGELSPEVLKHLDRALLQRVNDLRAILDILPGLNQEGFFKGAIDLQRIGLMGRSLGGATTLAALGLEPRFKAGVAVVAPSVPDFRPFMPESLMAASSEESTMFSSDEKFPLGQLSRPTFLLNSAEDALILNINMALAMTFQSMSPSDVNPHPVLRHAFETSKAPVVWGMFDNGNHGIVSVSGPYWWPQLRPDRFPRYFDKATQYKLMPARQAHQIHIEKVLQFFDLTIRGDQTAKARLLDNPWKDQGFELEARNLD